MKRRGHPRIKINGVEDYCLICCDMVDEFADELSETTGMTYNMDEQDQAHYDYEFQFMWSNRSVNLIERYLSRLIKLGEKHWPENEIDIYCSRVID